MKNLILIFIGLPFSVFILFTIINAEPSPISHNEKIKNTSKKETAQYSSTWESGANPPILKTLLKNRVRGCGEIKYKKSNKHSNEYLVYCTRDGTNWHSAYIVFTKSQDVMGPYNTDPKYD